MLALTKAHNDILKKESERDSKEAQIEVRLSVAAASRSAGDSANDQTFRDMASKLATEL